MKDKIIEVLKSSNRAIDIFDISDLLGLASVEDMKVLMDTLRSLEDEAIVYHTNKDRYMLIENSHLKKGIMRANKKGFGFVDVEELDDDIYISKDNMNGAIHDDFVLVEVTSKLNIDRLEGRVLRIIKRSATRYIGEINFSHDIGYVTLDDAKINLKIEVARKDALNAVDGHKVVVSLGEKIDHHGRYTGKVEEIIGHKNDPGVDILSIVYKYNIQTEFSDEVKQEVSEMPMEVLESDLSGRRDLRDMEIFTIDGDDTKDIDDAISISYLPNGNYKLGVHIADVSYYVKEGSPLDLEAMERGTSVYLVDRVIPMLPHELSNGICSLNPNVDRLAISCMMEFDQEGKQVDYEIFPSVIRSRIQMTYKNVNRILMKNEVPEGYESYVSSLGKMEELAQILRRAKDKRGYIDFSVDEAKILVDDACKPVEVVLRDRGLGEMLIEDFMIAANECVASHIFYMELPFIYRVHEYPKEERIRSYLSFIGTLGYQIPGNIKDTRPKTIQNLVHFLSDKKEFKILSSLLLRSMQKAVYKEENLGHYGLASPCYTHFTSPIRRYPDTTVHRLLRIYLFKEDISAKTRSHWEQKLVYIAEHSSSRERASIDCEREVEDMKMAEYMEEHIGEEYEGMICSVMSFGMFIQLDNLIEGLVPIRDMLDFFHYDEERMTLTGERSHITYTIGERVLVKVVRASKEERTIDFEIIKKV